jgi:hypothetical protein
MVLGTVRVQCVVALEYKQLFHYFNIIICKTEMLSQFYTFLACHVKPYFSYVTRTIELRIGYIPICHDEESFITLALNGVRCEDDEPGMIYWKCDFKIFSVVFSLQVKYRHNNII